MKGPLNILLIEDNRGDAELIEEMIRNTEVPYDLTWINNGQSAIDFLNGGKRTDLIMLDLKIPRVSGHEILSFLFERGVTSKVPVVVMSGSTYQGDVELTRKMGATLYLLKPMSINEMDDITKILKDIMLKQRSDTDPIS